MRSFEYSCAIFGAVISVLTFASSSSAADTQSFQNWKVDCPKPGECVAHFETSGLQVLIGHATPKAPLRMAMRVPVSLKPGSPVAIRLNDGWQAGLRVGNCTKDYCEAAVAEKSTSVAVSALQRNQSGVVAYQLNDRILLVPISLAGFTDALKQVSS